MSTLNQMLETTCTKAGIPGIACAISVKGKVHYYYAGKHSHISGAPKVSRETIFDLASLTKVLTTHQLFLKLITENQPSVGCGALDRSWFDGSLVDHSWHMFRFDLTRLGLTQLGLT